MVTKILNAIRFLARQALLLQGHYDDSDGNLHKLLKLQASDDQELAEWLQRKVSRHTSPEILNTLINENDGNSCT